MSSRNYIIDDVVVFIPKDKVLRSLATQKSLSIHSPAAKCLLLLIERRELVSQADLYKAAWGDDALKKVSSATYYQCFVNLRKALKYIGYDGELIKTIHKEGVIINEDIAITEYTPSACIEMEEKGRGWKLSKKQSILSFMVMSIIAIYSLYALQSHDGSELFGDERYIKISGLPDCVYVYKGSPEGVSTRRVVEILEKRASSCKNKHKIFVYLGSIRTTIFDCPPTMHCMSYTDSRVNK